MSFSSRNSYLKGLGYDKSNYYTLDNKNITKAINFLDNNLDRRLRERNEISDYKIKSLKNNYYELKHQLSKKFNDLERSNEIILDYVKNSIRNDDYKYPRYLESNNKKDLYKVITNVPDSIHRKLKQAYLDELEEYHNQNHFLKKLRHDILSEFRYQRHKDNLRYQKKIDELKQVIDEEEREKNKLLEKMNYKKELDKLNYFYHFYGHNNCCNQHNNNSVNSLPFDEILKYYFFKDILKNDRYNNVLKFNNKMMKINKDILKYKFDQDRKYYRYPKISSTFLTRNYSVDFNIHHRHDHFTTKYYPITPIHQYIKYPKHEYHDHHYYKLYKKDYIPKHKYYYIYDKNKYKVNPVSVQKEEYPVINTGISIPKNSNIYNRKRFLTLLKHNKERRSVTNLIKQNEYENRSGPYSNSNKDDNNDDEKEGEESDDGSVEGENEEK